MHKATLTDRINPTAHLNPAKSKTDNEPEREFWSRVDKETVRLMYDIYRLDFEMFGYSIEEYLGDLGLGEKLQGWYSGKLLWQG